MRTTRSGRSEQQRTAERRAVIAAGALALVDEVGHAQVTVAAVAERLGIPVPTVMYHFPTRAHLLVAAQAQNDAENEGHARAQAEAAGGFPSVSAAVLAVSQAEAGKPNRLRLHSYLLGEAVDPNHPAAEHYRAALGFSTTAFADMLRELQAQGQAHPGINPDTAARQIVAAWNGLQALWLLNPTFDFATEAAQVVRDITRQDQFEARQAFADLAEQML